MKIRFSKIMLLMTDMILFLISAILSVLICQVFGLGFDDWWYSQDYERYLTWLLVVFVGHVFIMTRYRHYSDRKPFWTEFGELLGLLFVLAVLDLALVSLARWNSSRLWWIYTWIFSALLIPIGRNYIKRLMCFLNIWQRPTLIIGTGNNAQGALAALQSEWELGFEIKGFIDMTEVSAYTSPSTLFVDDKNWPLFSAANLSAWAKVQGVQFVVAMDHEQNDLREDCLRRLAHLRAVDVSIIPDMRGVPLYGTDISYFYSHEVALLKLRNNLRYWPARLLKRIFDVVAATILLILLSPLFIYLSYIIRKDGGAAIYSHTRIGRGGHPFACYKFRSMCVDAEHKLIDLLASDQELRNEWEREFKLKDDPRISKIGQMLRRTSLDELPQIFNVIKGEMSLVGPRPVIHAELARYGYDVDYFLMVRPGITGLWQVSGRSDLDYDKRVYLDTWYVKNWSLWYDVAILFKTVNVVLGRKGAY